MCNFLKKLFNPHKPDAREVIKFDMCAHLPAKPPLSCYELMYEDAAPVQSALVTALQAARQKNALLELNFDKIDGNCSAEFFHRVFATLPTVAKMTPDEIIGTLSIISFETPDYKDECLDYIRNDRWRQNPAPKP